MCWTTIILGTINNDSLLIHPLYLIVTDHAFRVETIVTSSNIPKKVYHIVTDNFVNLENFIVPYVEEETFVSHVLIHTGIVNYFWQLLILYQIKFV